MATPVFLHHIQTYHQIRHITMEDKKPESKTDIAETSSNSVLSGINLPSTPSVSVETFNFINFSHFGLPAWPVTTTDALLRVGKWLFAGLFTGFFAYQTGMVGTELTLLLIRSPRLRAFLHC